MSWPHQMWNPSGSYSHVASADSVVTNLTEPEPPGQINVLSQDCFASPGAAITGLQGAAPLSYAGPGDFVVSTITVNPLSATGDSFTSITPSMRVGNPAGSGLADFAIYMGVNTRAPISDVIGFGMPGHETRSTGIVSLFTSFVGPDPTADLVLYLSNFSTVNTGSVPLKTGPFYSCGFVSTPVVKGVSSINGINWASISTAAGTV